MQAEGVRKSIEDTGVIAAIRVTSKDDALFAAEVIYHGGISVVEIAMTLDGAPEVISHLVEQHSGLVVGAGGVSNARVAQQCLDAGAQFLTSDGLHLALVEFAAKKGVVVLPGALTPTEVISAWEAGCDFVKVVPCAQIGGESYIRSLHAMYPDIPLVAAGGVHQYSAFKYIVAGAIALGIGRELMPAGAVRKREGERIRELARRFAGFVKDARAGTLPEREGGYVG